MTVVDAIRTRILALAPVTALVGQRVYVQRLPQSPGLPAVRLQRVSQVGTTHLRGAGGLKRARVQVDAVANNTRDGAVAVDEAIKGDDGGSGLSGWTGTVGAMTITGILPVDVREGFDAIDLNQYKVMRDYWVFFK